MIAVKATREGLVGTLTASQYRIDLAVSFVALPSVKALKRFVRVVNPVNGWKTIAEVLDVGPWNTHDDAYVFQPATQANLSEDAKVMIAQASGDTTFPINEETATGVRPLSESGVSVTGKGTNGAGIDLSEAVRAALGLTGKDDNEIVHWEFIE